MRDLTEEISERMLKEDPWLRSGNGMELFLVMGSSDDIPENLEVAVERAELDTADPVYGESAALHCILGVLYQSLPYELDDGLKRYIERSKLERNGDKRLFECRNMSPAELADFFSDETIYVQLENGPTFGVNFAAPLAYTTLANVRSYMSYDNSQRIYHHFDKALALSIDNPAVFEQIVEPAVIFYMTPLLLAKMVTCQDDIPYSANPLLGLLNEEYMAAKKRVGMMTDIPLPAISLPPLSTDRPTPI